MSAADVSAYDWIFEGDQAWFGDAACVTVAVGASRAQLAEAFGVDPESVPVPAAAGAAAERALGEGQALVSFTEVSGHQVAIERRSAGGIAPEVLLPLSVPGRAASASWSSDALARFACADGGDSLYDGEFVYDGTDGLPADLASLVALVADDLDDDLLAAEPGADQPLDISVALAMLETYTGVRITAPDLARALTEQFVRSV